MKNRFLTSGLAGVLGAVTVVSLSACGAIGTSSSEGSRAKFYSSEDALSADSTLIVSGTVSEQHVVQDVANSGDFTLSTFTVDATPKSDSSHAPGSTIVVRQIGSEKEAGPATLLDSDGTYLLYLTASGLDGDLASQFYVTGATAGLYKATDAGSNSARAKGAAASTEVFAQVQEDDGDDLPEQVTLEEAGE